MAVKRKFSAKEMVLAVASLFNGKTEQQICAELKISPAVFGSWLEKYGEIANEHSLLVNENRRLHKMFTDLSIINYFLNKAMEELRDELLT